MIFILKVIYCICRILNKILSLPAVLKTENNQRVNLIQSLYKQYFLIIYIANKKINNSFSLKSIFSEINMRFSVIFLLCLLKFVDPQSWLACTDYTQKNGRYWRPQRCRGFARDSEKYARKDSFGHDRSKSVFFINGLYLFFLEWKSLREFYKENLIYCL